MASKIIIRLESTEDDTLLASYEYHRMDGSHIHAAYSEGLTLANQTDNAWVRAIEKIAFIITDLDIKLLRGEEDVAEYK